MINVELPRSTEVYVHRIGRTGRGGKSALAASLFTDNERYLLDAIGQLQQQRISFEAIAAVAWSDERLAPRSS